MPTISDLHYIWLYFILYVILYCIIQMHDYDDTDGTERISSFIFLTKKLQQCSSASNNYHYY